MRYIIHKNRQLIRILSLATAFVVFCAGLGAYAEEGTGAVITISSPEDFADLSKNCVYDSYSRDMQVTLLNDIDMTGVDFEPMKIFCGTFEGGGHSITGVKLSFDGSQKGLCFELGEGGEIRNLNLSGEVKAQQNGDGAASIDRIIGSVAKNAGLNTSLSSENSEANLLGGIVGKNCGRIINCSFSGSIEGENTVGGIAGENSDSGYMECCYNVSSVLGEKNVGGIAGKNCGRIASCRNSGQINSSPVEESHNIGGICGMNEGAAVNCTNDGEIGYKNIGTNIGGIAGNQTGCIRECQNTGTVLGDKSVGGIFGRFEPYTDISVEDLDRVKDDINDIRENIKDDVNNVRRDTVGDIDDLRNRLNSDVNNILDRFDGGGLFSDLRGLNGVSLSLASAIAQVAGSQSGVLDALRDRINSGESGSLEDIREDLNRLTDSGVNLLDGISEETEAGIADAISSIDDVVGTVNGVNGALETLVGDIDGLINDVNDAYNQRDWDKMENKLDDLDDRLDYIQDDVLFPITESLTSSLNAITRAMNALRSDSYYIADSIAGPFEQAEDIINNAREQVAAINEKINGIKEKIEEIREKLHNIGQSESSKTVGFSDLFFMTAYADEELVLKEEDLKNELKNITSVDLDVYRNVGGEDINDGLVLYCYNSGHVSGRQDLGGIGGTMGIESAVKYGDNITLPGGKVISGNSIVKAVVNGCVCQGEVEGKSGCAGGVVGNADMGIIKNTVTETNVSCDEGTYVGGIAGYSGGKIYNCAAISDLSGTKYVGGIAGEARLISTCYALPRMEAGIEKSGAITGTAEGVVLNNYFIKEGLSGIDGADFDGKAVALDSTEITGTDIIPEKMQGFDSGDWYMAGGGVFLPQNRVLCENDAAYIGALLKAKSAEYAAFQFKVSFVADGETVYETVVDYDTVLDPNIVPRLEYRDGFCPQWDHNTAEPIRRNTVFRAEYLDAVKTIATSEEPPILLVEGNFPDGSQVAVHQVDVSGYFPQGYEPIASYSFEVTPNYSGKMRVHIRDKEEKGNYIGFVADGKTQILEAERDGSYLVFETGQQGEFTVLHKPARMWYVLGIILLAGGLLLLIAALAVKKSGKDKPVPKESEKEEVPID